MVSLIANQTIIAHLQNPTTNFNSFLSPINYPQLNFTKKVENYSRITSAHFFICKKGANFGLFDLNMSQVKGNLMCYRCMSGGDRVLEEKILEFMEKSGKPNRFPTKKELIKGGRFDLVEEIGKRGGWFSLGWEDMESEVGRVEESEIEAMESEIEKFKKRLECCGGSSLYRKNVGRDSFFGEESAQALPLPSSSGRSFVHREIMKEEESGVEGILSRLQRERNFSLGFDMGRNSRGPLSSSGDEGDRWNFRTSTSADRIDPCKNGGVMSGGTKKCASYDTGGYHNHNHYTKPDSWKVWSIQRAGAQITEVEAAEISYKRVENEKAPLNSNHVAATKSLSGLKEINPDQIQTRLKQLESELSYALQSLISVKEGSPLKGNIGSSSELQNLYDAWEFQENEVIRAKEKLRVIHAKVSVLKGKRSLLMGKPKNTEMLNRRRLEDARNALQLLRTTRIDWQNSASEVFLTGSFDGWTSQRKMEKSSSGIFCASLRLYPGRYEIKFIVDGIWRVDPLRPIVHNNGYANNLLIIT